LRFNRGRREQGKPWRGEAAGLKAELLTTIRALDFSEQTFRQQLERVPFQVWNWLLVDARQGFGTAAEACEVLNELSGRIFYRLPPGQALTYWDVSGPFFSRLIFLFNMKRMECEGKLVIDWPDQMEDAYLLFTHLPNPRIQMTELGKRTYAELSRKVALERSRN
jgi:hypothetical protein